jgi:hypothetical protein
MNNCTGIPKCLSRGNKAKERRKKERKKEINDKTTGWYQIRKDVKNSQI